MLLSQIPEAEAEFLAGESGEALKVEHGESGGFGIHGALAVKQAQYGKTAVLLALQSSKEIARAKFEANQCTGAIAFPVVPLALIGVAENPMRLAKAEEYFGVAGFFIVGMITFGKRTVNTTPPPWR